MLSTHEYRIICALLLRDDACIDSTGTKCINAKSFLKKFRPQTPNKTGNGMFCHGVERINFIGNNTCQGPGNDDAATFFHHGKEKVQTQHDTVDIDPNQATVTRQCHR